MIDAQTSAAAVDDAPVGPPPFPGAAGRWIGWGAYLGCSWTWCIGMFLPVLLVRDFGPWAFAVFAVPNVVGAAAMGWVLREPVGEEWLARHRPAMAWFARATVAFQAFFLGWVSGSVHAWWIGPAVLAVGGLTPQPDARGWRRLAVMVWSISVACAAVVLTSGPAAGRLVETLGRPGRLPAWDLAALAPVCVFGFALCPYLDATFHRARGSLDRKGARTAFSSGFGVFFLAMILFTLVYTPMLVERGPAALTPIGWASAAVLAHFALQIGFTVFAFLDAVDRLGPWGAPGARSGGRTLGGLGPVVLMAGAYAAGLLAPGHTVPVGGGMDAGELTYRCFMALYGLVFPAYVWLCAMPGTARSKKSLVVFWIASAAAAPWYWMGFVERQTWCLAVGVGIVLLARLAARGAHTVTPPHVRTAPGRSPDGPGMPRERPGR